MTTSENGRTKQQKDVKSEYVQKLSNEKALAEAVLIGNKPSLIVVDFTDSVSDTRIGIMDSLAYNGGETRLKPELLSNRPYSFKSREEFNAYIERARSATLDTLFFKTLSIWKKYIDADDLHLKICAADTIFTYFQDRIGMTHYLFFVADNDAGKSNNLLVFNVLGYRNLMSTSMTYANVYHFLGNKDEGVGTICYDEADTIDENHDIMGIFKEGYTTGHPVVRIVDTANGRKQLKLNTYGFKAFAGERLPDAFTARGFLQRIVVLKCLPGYPKYDISEVLNPAGDEEYQELLDELNDLRIMLFCYRLVHFKDKIPNIKLNIRNREKQLFKPLLRLFQETMTFETLKPVVSEFIRERRKDKANSYHAFLYRIIIELIESNNNGILELESSTIWSFIKSNLTWKEIPYKPQSIETVEFGILSQKDVTSTLKQVFHAKPPKHKSSARSLIFSQDVLNRMKDTYEMDVEIKVDFEAHEAHEALFGSACNDSNDSDNIENEERKEESNKNYEEIKTESNNNDEESTVNTPLHLQNVPQAPQAPQTSESWPVGNPEQSRAWYDEYDRLQREHEK